MFKKKRNSQRRAAPSPKKRNPKAVFRVDPSKLGLVDVPGIGKVPRVIEYLKKEMIERGGLEKKGIFRNAGDELVMNDIRRKLDSGDMRMKCKNVNNFATVIKIWFRELPVRLFDSFPNAYEHIESVRTMNTKVSSEIVRKMSKNSQVLLDWVMDLMMEVEERCEVNKMTVTNLAIVFAPNLYSKKKGNIMEMMQMSSKMGSLFTSILESKIAEKSSGSEKPGVLLQDYDYEDVNVKKDENITVLAVVDEYTYVRTEGGQECYVPTNYIHYLNQTEEEEEEEEEGEEESEEEESEEEEDVEVDENSATGDEGDDVIESDDDVDVGDSELDDEEDDDDDKEEESDEEEATTTRPGKSNKSGIDPKRIKDRPLVEGHLVKEGKVNKSWKRRHFRIFHKAGFVNYYANDKSEVAKGFIPLKDLEVKRWEYKQKPFCFVINSLVNKKRTYYISCPDEKSRELWIRKIIRSSKFSERKKFYTSEEEKQTVIGRCEKIFAEYRLRKNYALSFKKVKVLNKKYPNALHTGLLLSKFLAIKSKLKSAISALEKKRLVNLLDTTMQKMEPKDVEEQYEVHFRIGSLLIDLHKKTKKKELIERSVFYFLTSFQLKASINQCCYESIHQLGDCYLKLQNYETSIYYYKQLILSSNSAKYQNQYFGEFIHVVKMSGDENQLFKMLVDSTKNKKLPVPKAYEQLANVLDPGSMKKFRALLLQKRDFYSFVAVFSKKIKFSDENYEQYRNFLKLTRSKSKEKISEMLHPILSDKSLEKSEFLSGMLHYVDTKKDGNSNWFKECSLAISQELGDRVRYSSEENINLLLTLYEESKTPFITVDILRAIVRNKKVLKKRNKYDDFFKSLVDRFYTNQEQFMYAFEAFEKLKDAKVVPFLITGLTHAKKPKFRLQCLFSLPKFKKKKNKGVMKKKLRKVVKQKGVKFELKCAGAAVLFRITKKKKWIKNTFAKTKGSRIPKDVMEFIKVECKDGKKIVKYLNTPVKKRPKNWK